MQSTTIIHITADIHTLHIGNRTNIWQFVVILPDAKIGTDCNICAHVFIENDVVVGDRVTIKNSVQLWDGIHVEDDVFIGPTHFLKTLVCKGASIGANATILPGLTIGAKAILGAGSVVTHDAPHAIVVGNPARIIGYNSGSHWKTAEKLYQVQGDSSIGGMNAFNNYQVT